MPDQLLDTFVRSIMDGDQAGALEGVNALIASGYNRKEIVTAGVEEAMNRLDAKCTVQQFNLLEIMLSGRAVMEVMKTLYPPDAPLPANKGIVVLATLEGDVHDLGKSIVRMILMAKGYQVVDCGKDCPVISLMETIERVSPLVVGISGLITTVVPLVRTVKDALEERSLTGIKVMAGGSTLKQIPAEQLNVDYVAETAFDSVKYIESLVADSR